MLAVAKYSISIPSLGIPRIVALCPEEGGGESGRCWPRWTLLASSVAEYQHVNTIELESDAVSSWRQDCPPFRGPAVPMEWELSYPCLPISLSLGAS